MADKSRLRVYPTRDRAEVIMVGTSGIWRQRVPAEDLPGWVTLYRGLRDRDNGRFSDFYAQPVAALEKVCADLGLTIPTKGAPTPKARKITTN